MYCVRRNFKQFISIHSTHFHFFQLISKHMSKSLFLNNLIIYKQYSPPATQGQAALTAVLFLAFIMLAITFGFSSLALKQARIARVQADGERSFYLSEAGLEDVMYRYGTARNVGLEEVLRLDGYSATTTTVVNGNEYIITSKGEYSSHVRKANARMTVLPSGNTFHYGVQVGAGGMSIQNTASVQGNVYSNGPVEGQNSNIIKGDVVSAGASGVIDGIRATSSAYAHTIRNSIIDRDAYYQSLSNTTVGGIKYPNSPDQPIVNLPISDDVIEGWKEEASANVISSPCPYKIENDITLGPVHITCNVEIQGDPTVTLGGALWVEGNLDIQNTAIIRIASSLGKKSVPVVVDKPSNRITSSKATLQNSVQFLNSGTEGSYILVVSQNNSAENGGSEIAIDVKNTINGDVLVYAGHGEIQLQNSIKLREVTAYKVRLKNSAEVIYESGLANLIFTSGPTGGGVDVESWKEIQ